MGGTQGPQGPVHGRGQADLLPGVGQGQQQGAREDQLQAVLSEDVEAKTQRGPGSLHFVLELCAHITFGALILDPACSVTHRHGLSSKCDVQPDQMQRARARRA